MKERGCVFFYSGIQYTLKLLVSIYSLREVYNGPVTLFVFDKKELRDKNLCRVLEPFNIDIQWIDDSQFFKAYSRSSVLRMSPYKTMLIFDADLLFLKPFDELWQPLEEKGVLLTQFYPNPYGIGGSPERGGWVNRVYHLSNSRDYLSKDEINIAQQGLVEGSYDINIGVMGYSRGQGDAYIQEYCSRLEKAAQDSRKIFLLDELVALALSHKYPHYLAEEKWNCPANVFFRRTDPNDAAILHFFADGLYLKYGKTYLGRHPSNPAAQIWFSKLKELRKQVDITFFYPYDDTLITHWYWKDKDLLHKVNWLKWVLYKTRSSIQKYSEFSAR